MLRFTVDAALLRELGERLVGKAHIALAELVKNAYDADATEVLIRFGQDDLEVSDNGVGMTLKEFERFWLRVGSPHKQREPASPLFKRPITGSKGVGRLAMQFLARDVELRTVSRETPGVELRAIVDWDKAVASGELTSAEAAYMLGTPTGEFPRKKTHGTRIILRRLQQHWTAEDIRRIAEEIWPLQPPFRPNPRISAEAARDFTVGLEGADPEALKAFQAQMTAALRGWEARIVGSVRREGKGLRTRGTVEVTVEFAGAAKERSTFELPTSALHEAEFEIRVYRLQNRQGRGIRVAQARDYFSEFGGVHIYDAGFHLPYYGPNTDWLNIERDHAARLTRSKLLPDELQVDRGLNYLPTQRRLFGVVHVDTAREQRLARREANGSSREALTIQVSRDRLIDNRALGSLREAVRAALDYYATRAALRAAAEAETRRPTEPLSEKAERVGDVLDKYASEMDEQVYAALRREIDDVVSAAESEAEAAAKRVGLLGPLATAGITALAYDHELGKQFEALRRVAQELRGVPVREPEVRESLAAVSRDLEDWVDRARGTRALFTHLTDEENRTARVRLKVRPTVLAIVNQVRALMRGVVVDTQDIDVGLRLPPGTYAEWAAIFQNVIVNAITATLDSRDKRIAISSRASGQRRMILVQDSGIGVDLAKSEQLFDTFAREIRVSAGRRELGYGGTGLGLAIARMVATNVGCRVAFVEPDRAEGYRTAFQLTWKESA